MDNYHISVLLQEALDFLAVEGGKKYIDGTLGGGGHTREILKRGGKVLGIDLDEEALAQVEKILRDKDIKILSEKKDESLNILVSQYPNITLVRGNFRDIGRIAKENGFEKVSGVLLDLGVSSHQIDTAERGFSFAKEGPLDMRMGRELGVTAADLINGLTKDELVDLFDRFGEERFSRPIAKRIVEERLQHPITTTTQLTEVIERVVRQSKGEIHPATRIFQALRILVNDELRSIEEVLPQALELLDDKGRIVIISFHSLEDRIVKRTFEQFENEGKGVILTKKPIVPTDSEMERNRRSRSSKMRVFERRI